MGGMLLLLLLLLDLGQFFGSPTLRIRKFHLKEMGVYIGEKEPKVLVAGGFNFFKILLLSGENIYRHILYLRVLCAGDQWIQYRCVLCDVILYPNCAGVQSSYIGAKLITPFIGSPYC